MTVKKKNAEGIIKDIKQQTRKLCSAEKKSEWLLKECEEKILLNLYAANMAWWCKYFMEARETFKWRLT